MPARGLHKAKAALLRSPGSTLVPIWNRILTWFSQTGTPPPIPGHKAAEDLRYVAGYLVFGD